MSSASDGSSPRIYYCHPCETTVSVVPIDDDPFCPICGGSFLEEVDVPEFNSNSNSIEIRNSEDFADLVGYASTPSRSQSPDNQSFDLQHFVQDYISGGTGIQVSPPPAARSAVEALPITKISPKMVRGKDAHCAVCKDAFYIGDEAMRMPCMHLYHENCIVPWLELHNSCPVCRYKLPTGDGLDEDFDGLHLNDLVHGGAGSDS